MTAPAAARVLTAIGTDATNTFEDLSGIATLVQKKLKRAVLGATGGYDSSNSTPGSPAVASSVETSDTEVDLDNPYDVLIQAFDNDPVCPHLPHPLSHMGELELRGSG